MELKATMTYETGNDGFTLVEILVSTVILSLGAVVLMQALGRAAFAATSAANHRQACLFAQAKMAETELALRQGQELPETDSGSFESDHVRFGWSRSCRGEENDPHRKQVSLSVLWGEGGGHSEQRVETFLEEAHDPNESKK